MTARSDSFAGELQTNGSFSGLQDGGISAKSVYYATLSKKAPSLRVVVFTSNPTLGEGVAAIRAGAKGYGPKNLSKSLVRKAADVVSRGELWIGRDLVPALIEELVRHSGKRASGVNSRGNGQNSSRLFTMD